MEYGITPTNIIGIHSNGSLFVSGPIDIEAMPVDEEGTLTYTVSGSEGERGREQEGMESMANLFRSGQNRETNEQFQRFESRL